MSTWREWAPLGDSQATTDAKSASDTLIYAIDEIAVIIAGGEQRSRPHSEIRLSAVLDPQRWNYLLEEIANTSDPVASVQFESRLHQGVVSGQERAADIELELPQMTGERVIRRRAVENGDQVGSVDESDVGCGHGLVSPAPSRRADCCRGAAVHR